MTTERANIRVADDLRTLAHDAEELMKATAGQAGVRPGEMNRRLATALESATDACRRLEDKAIIARKASGPTNRQRIYESIGIAFGLGLLVGVLLARK